MQHLDRGEVLLEFQVRAEKSVVTPQSFTLGTHAPHSTVILDCGIVTIGDRVMFGPFVSIFAATHETEVQSRRDNIEFAREVKIGDDCWIGGHVTILPGVTIGQGSTIGSNSIVTKDVPAWSVAMGSPARVVKKVSPVPPPGNSVERSNG
jgi:acetyltransferase-like isoleucine patch superfamily enzyme